MSEGAGEMLAELTFLPRISGFDGLGLGGFNSWNRVPLEGVHKGTIKATIRV